MPALRLLSWNVHGLPFGVSERRRWRLGAIAQVVRQERPDVVTLQEVWLPADADYLAETLAGVATDPGRPGYRALDDTGWALAIDPAIPLAGLMALPYSLTRPWRKAGLLTLVRKDGPWRFEAESFHEFENEASDWAFWQQDGKLDKGIQRVRLVHASGQSVDVVNTHLQAEYSDPLAYADVRKAQIGELTRFVARESGDVPVVCTGDLNTAAPVPGDDFDREVYEHLTRTHGWRDLTEGRRRACRSQRPRPFWNCTTVLSSDGRSDWIDYVLTRAGDCVGIQELRVLANEEADQPWSDHHGLLADLRVGDGEACRLPLALAALAPGARPRRRDLLALAGLAAAELLLPD